MATWKGFGRLKTTGDLLEKMRHDHQRMLAQPADEYAAMDFFIASEHMVDWRWPGASEKETRRDARSRDPLATVSHLASGAKHFEATAPHHDRVEGVTTDAHLSLGSAVPGLAMPGVTVVGHVAFGPPFLTVMTTDGRQIPATALAGTVLEYWTTELGSGGIHEPHAG